jgi:alpha-galactosidase
VASHNFEFRIKNIIKQQLLEFKKEGRLVLNIRIQKKSLWIFLVIFSFGGCELALAKETSAMNEWINQRFREPQSGQFYFSFIYDGKPSSDFLKDWNVTTKRQELDSDRIQHITEYLDPTTGLLVRSTAIIYRDFSAVEWVLHFSNTGDQDTPIIEHILPLNSAVVSSEAAQFTLHTSTGDYNSAKSFCPSQTILKPDSTVTLSAHKGRSSSDGFLPFFNMDWENGGVAMALGWSGQWQAQFGMKAPNQLHIKGGMQHTHLKLLPGETIRTPRMLLAFWEGNEPIDGNNVMRQLLIKHYLPRQNGKLVMPPVMGSITDTAPDGTYEAPHLKVMPILADRGIEVFWSDMNPQHWYPLGFPKGTGTWVPDPKKYPNGLAPISQAAHDAGMGYLLWFEPERVAEGTQIDSLCPQWLSKKGPADPVDQFLFRMDIPEARDWLIEHIDDQIRAANIDWLRYDFNLDPLEFWQNTDTPDRQGMTEIRHIEGLYAFWDELLRRHPNMALDNCASGGRRIDLETISRGLPLWHSDLQCLTEDPEADQLQNGGLYRWIPLHGCGDYGYEPSYNFRSAMSSGGIFTNHDNDSMIVVHRQQEAKNLSELGIVPGPWHFIGPFINEEHPVYSHAFGPEFKIDLDKSYENGTLIWQQMPDWFDGEQHVFSTFESKIKHASYVYREIHATSDTLCRIYFGSNDGYKVFINGEFVQGEDIGRSLAIEDTEIELPFKKGTNQLLIKITNKGNTTGFYYSTVPFPGGWFRQNSADPHTRNAVKRSVAMYKKMRPYLLGDFYPLFPHLSDLDVWYGYQFHRPNFDDGAIVLFRRPENRNAVQDIQIKGLKTAQKYEFMIQDTGEKKVLSGKEKLSVTIAETPGSQIIFYKKR